MEELHVKSFAKINIGLNIIRKRSDGYHDIESIFYPINFHDDLYFKKSDSFKLICSNQEINEQENLVTKAIKILENETKQKFNVEISLTKRIPIGAGLGGGSSNAAQTIVALNKLFQLNLSEETQKDLAAKVGADAPFFINSSPSLVTSKGEKLEALSLKIKFPILIVNPGIQISTKWAYENINPSGKTNLLGNLFKQNISDVHKWKEKIFNGFERIVFEKHREIAEIKDNLYKSGAIFSLMTGSGSTVYGIFENINEAEKAQSQFSKNYITYIHKEID